MNRNLLLTLIVIAAGVLGWGLNDVFKPSMPPRTCESVLRERIAFQQCLRHQPACSHAGVESFIRYYDNRDWLRANCPDTDSGDGFLSQHTDTEVTSNVDNE